MLVKVSSAWVNCTAVALTVTGVPAAFTPVVEVAPPEGTVVGLLPDEPVLLEPDPEPVLPVPLLPLPEVPPVPPVGGGVVQLGGVPVWPAGQVGGVKATLPPTSPGFDPRVGHFFQP